MKRFTDAIRRSLKYRNWYGALALALTLPDICGKIAYPTVRASAKRYERWFNQYLGEVNQMLVGETRVVFLTGRDCYALRCAYLHRGGDDISDQTARETLKRFFFTTMNAHRVRVEATYLTLNVRTFCLEVCDAVEAWTSETAGDERVLAEIQNLLIVRTEAFSPGPGVAPMYVATLDECKPLEDDAAHRYDPDR